MAHRLPLKDLQRPTSMSTPSTVLQPALLMALSSLAIGPAGRSSKCTPWSPPNAMPTIPVAIVASYGEDPDAPACRKNDMHLPENINPFLYTHINYAFVFVSNISAYPLDGTEGMR